MLLEELVVPQDYEDFCQKYLFKKPYASPGSAQAFRKLFHWEMLIEILNSKYSDCWLARYGKLPQDPALASGVLSFSQAKEYFDQGYSIVVRHAEKAHSKLAAIAEDFGAHFQAPIDIQLYCTPPDEEGFDWHFDVEEVFVIQSSGAKEFRLRPPSAHFKSGAKVDLPKTIDLSKDLPGPEMTCTLKAGDFLYIPAGHWHKAKALSPSFHLSVGVLKALPPT